MRPLDVAEELVAQAVAGVRPLDQARDVGHDEVLVLGDDGTQVGILGGEGIIGDLGMGPGDPREQRGLAGVGQADEPDVGDDLQLQDDPALLAGMPLLDLSRRPIGRRLEVGIAVAAPAAPGHDHLVAGAP